MGKVVKNVFGNLVIMLVIFALMVGWIFSGWPELLEFRIQNLEYRVPPEVQEVLAETEYKKPTNFTDASVWSDEALAYDSTSNDQTTYADSGTAPNDLNPWITFHTWDTKGQTYTATALKVNWKTDGLWSDDLIGISYTKDGGSNWIVLVSLAIHNETTMQTASADLDANQDLTLVQVKAIIDRTKGGDVGHLYIYDIWTEGTYTPPANDPPNVPSQDAPSNNATDISVTPTFQASTTDPDGDNLSYKITIYSDACSTVHQTHDQAIDDTGWSGQDGSCTNNPTSCYLSGTQASFTLQSGDVLNYETQYWWRASAKDPDGSDTFTDSTTCNTFTTAVEVVISIVSIVPSSFDYGFLSEDATTTFKIASSTATGIIVTNGSVTADYKIRGATTTGGTVDWTLGASAGENIYVHRFEESSVPDTWTALTLENQTLKSGVAADGTIEFDLEIHTPTISADVGVQKSVPVTVVAVGPEWPDGEGYIYNEGMHEDMWVEGYSKDDGSQSKEGTYLYLYVGYNIDLENGVRTWVINETVNLTNFNSLIIDWEVSLAGSIIDGQANLVISDDKNGDSSVYDGIITVSGDRARATSTLDISSSYFNNDFYVRVHASAGDDDGNVKTYRVWLE